MRVSRKIIINIILIYIFNSVYAQDKFQLHADLLTGFSKFKLKNEVYKTQFNETVQIKSYCPPVLNIGIGLSARFKNWSLGYDYNFQEYNEYADLKVIYPDSSVRYSKGMDIDDYYIHKLRLGIVIVKHARWQSELMMGYAFPAINYWGFRRGYSATYDQQGNQIDKYWIYKCRASGYSVSLNTGIISKNQKSKISLTLGSEWLSNNTPNMFESDWMTSVEKNTWYYSVGLRYSRLMKEWGKNK